jgi:hypothetical protein
VLIGEQFGQVGDRACVGGVGGEGCTRVGNRSPKELPKSPKIALLGKAPPPRPPPVWGKERSGKGGVGEPSNVTDSHYFNHPSPPPLFPGGKSTPKASPKSPQMGGAKGGKVRDDAGVGGGERGGGEKGGRETRKAAKGAQV